MPNSYGFNEEKNIDGESMLDWQTGSSNVLFKLLVNYVFGICPEFDGLWVQPASYAPFESFEFKIKIKACDIRLSYKYTGNGGRVFAVNGIRREGIVDPVMQLSKLWISNKELGCEEISISVSDGI